MILQPIVETMARLGSPFQGVLYAGLMVVKGVPYVLEFNARMGDRETQVVLPLLKTDLIDVIEAVVEDRLDQLVVDWHDETAVCVVMTSGGYPGPYQQGMPIHGLAVREATRAMIFHAGTAMKNGMVVTAGGRVLGITGRGTTLKRPKRMPIRPSQGFPSRTATIGRTSRTARSADPPQSLSGLRFTIHQVLARPAHPRLDRGRRTC